MNRFQKYCTDLKNSSESYIIPDEDKLYNITLRLIGTEREQVKLLETLKNITYQNFQLLESQCQSLLLKTMKDDSAFKMLTAAAV